MMDGVWKLPSDRKSRARRKKRGFLHVCMGGGENEKLTEPPYQGQLDHRCIPYVEKSLEFGGEESGFRESSSGVHLMVGV